jgi:arylsulfatase
MGDFGLVGKGQYLSEVLMRVPFFVKPPVPAGPSRSIREFVSLVDIAPTLLDVAGLTIPEDWNGRTLVPFWSKDHPVHADGAWKRHRETCYLEAQGVRGLRWENWKLITYQDRHYGELYDLDADPDEINNLWDVPARIGEKSLLLQKLIDALLALEPKIRSPWNTGAPAI